VEKMPKTYQWENEAEKRIKAIWKEDHEEIFTLDNKEAELKMLETETIESEKRRVKLEKEIAEIKKVLGIKEGSEKK